MSRNKIPKKTRTGSYEGVALGIGAGIGVGVALGAGIGAALGTAKRGEAENTPDEDKTDKP